LGVIKWTFDAEIPVPERSIAEWGFDEGVHMLAVDAAVGI
jgi:hypothetical protein